MEMSPPPPAILPLLATATPVEQALPSSTRCDPIRHYADPPLPSTALYSFVGHVRNVFEVTPAGTRSSPLPQNQPSLSADLHTPSTTYCDYVNRTKHVTT